MTWTTRDELAFIDSIGSYINPYIELVGVAHKLYLTKCLEGYLSSCIHRADWGEVDKLTVVERAKQRLYKLRTAAPEREHVETTQA